MFLAPVTRTELWRVSSNQYDKRWTLRPKTRPSRKISEKPYLAELTFLINQRPLYPSSNEIWESPPITPNDLLIENHFRPPMKEVESKVNPRHLTSSTEKRVQGF